MTHHARWVLVPSVVSDGTGDPSTANGREPKYRDTEGIDTGGGNDLDRGDAHAITPGIDRGGPMTDRVFCVRFVAEGRAGERALTSIVRSSDTHALGASTGAIAALFGRAVPEHSGRPFEAWDRDLTPRRGPPPGVPGRGPPDDTGPPDDGAGPPDDRGNGDPPDRT